MSFQEKYRPISAPMEGECRPLRALQSSTGRPVLVHRLPPAGTPSDQPDLESLLFRFLHSKLSVETRHVLDMGEDEGQTCVVTADVPQCLDLRKWLESAPGTRPWSEEDTEPFARLPGRPNPDGTPADIRDLLHQALGNRSRPAPPAPDAVRPNFEPPERVPAEEVSPPRIPPVSRKVRDRRAPNFAGFWERSLWSSPLAQPGSTLGPARGGEDLSAASEATTAFPTSPADAEVHEAPTIAMETLRAQKAQRERPRPTLVGPPMVGPAPGEFSQAAPPAPGPAPVPGPAVEGEAAYPPPQIDLPPDALPSATLPLFVRVEPPVEHAIPQPEAAISPLPPVETGKPGAGATSDIKPARKRMPAGFEVVFPSDRPRTHPQLANPLARPGDPAGPVQTPRPNAASPGGTLTGIPAIGVPTDSGGQEVGAGPDADRPPWLPPSPPADHEVEKATRWYPAAPLSPPDSLPPAAHPGSVPATSNRPEAGRIHLLAENNQTLAITVPPLDQEFPPTASPGPAGPNPAYSQPSYPGASPAYPVAYPQTPPPVRHLGSYAHGSWKPPSARKRYAWVPIVILGGLALITVALLLFFALKH